MASEDAWNAGWKTGSQAAAKKKKPKSSESSSNLGVAPLKTFSFKKGGTVKQTGIYKLHKGETVTPAHKTHEKHMRKRVSSKY